MTTGRKASPVKRPAPPIRRGSRCAHCGKQFRPTRPNQRYCTEAHKKAASRVRIAAEKVFRPREEARTAASQLLQSQGWVDILARDASVNGIRTKYVPTSRGVLVMEEAPGATKLAAGRAAAVAARSWSDVLVSDTSAADPVVAQALAEVRGPFIGSFREREAGNAVWKETVALLKDPDRKVALLNFRYNPDLEQQYPSVQVAGIPTFPPLDALDADVAVRWWDERLGYGMKGPKSRIFRRTG